jgi:hypothetical protein
MLLYGVPFQYLVPDERMLPPESILFFYVNPDWINCLLQGACSIGRANATDELADQILRQSFFDASQKIAAELRSAASAAAAARRGEGAEDHRGGAAHGARPPSDPAPPPQPATKQPATNLNWPLTGYLLRSAAVEAWVGLEARAKGVDQKGAKLEPLQILRMDRLAPDILLCIFNGRLKGLEISQPPEAIHFGAAANPLGPGYKPQGHHKLHLRRITEDSKGKMGGSIESEPPNTPLIPVVPERYGFVGWGRGSPPPGFEHFLPNNVPVVGSTRVVRVGDLVAEIKEILVKAGQMAERDAFTSAEFAAEMIESPAKVQFGESCHDRVFVRAN